MGSIDLEIHIQAISGGSHVADVKLTPAGVATPTTLARQAPLQLDPAALLPLSLDARAYGAALTAQLFASAALTNAWRSMQLFAAGATSTVRVRLRLTDADATIQALAWETLCDPIDGQPLALNQRLLFSRAAESDVIAALPTPARPGLRALLLIASPSDLPNYGLQPIPARSLIHAVRAALRPARLTVLGPGKASLAQLREALGEQPHLLILVCHGRMVDDSPYLFLESAGGTSDPVAPHELAERIAVMPRQPLLAVLAACQSAGSDDARATGQAAGPLLSRAGVPAVVAMRDQVAFTTVRALLPRLLGELLKDGVIDRALAAARSSPRTGEAWAQSVLWMRSRDGRLWLTPEEAPPSPWHNPADLRSAGAWLAWLRYNRRALLRFGLRLLVLYLLVAALAQWVPFQPREGWQRLGPNPPVPALALLRVGDTLLLGTNSTETGCSPDTGIWRSADGGTSWSRVRAPLAFAGDPACPTLAAVRGFAATATTPPQLYAATSNAGLLHSDGVAGVGIGWMRVGEQTRLPNQLRAVISLPDDPQRLFVLSEPGNLFRSTDAGKSWERIDGEATCPNPAHNLPDQINAQALLASGGSVYLGTRGTLADAALDAGLYASADGGSCWLRIHDGKQRYRYFGFAEPDAEHLLALTYDYHGVEGQQFQLWSVPRAGGDASLLWQSGWRALAVFIDSRAPQYWYIVDGSGALLQGRLDASAPPRELARILRCIFACNIAVAPDPLSFDEGVPLLLAEDQVYRYGKVPWYRALWP